MNRTDRLYAISEELRRVGRQGTSGPRLARLFEVSERTIKRDISALQQRGAPIWAQAGRGGGYLLDGSASLPPVNFTPAQAVAISVALATLPPGSPFAVDAATARGKLWDALSAGDRDRAAQLSARVWTRAPGRAGSSAAGGSTVAEVGAGLAGASSSGATSPAVLRAVEQALAAARVLAITYRTGGEVTRRSVEPILLAYSDRWYLVAWCRLRGAVRWFRLARIGQAHLTVERYVPRDVASVGTPPDDAAPVGYDLGEDT